MLRKVAICVALLICLAVPVPAQLPSTPYSSSLLLGAAWYPEQWSESHWEADLSLMEAAHIHLVRIGEFAWSSMEPREGHYELNWLDHAVRAAERHHIAVVIGTPTATPPAWLTANSRGQTAGAAVDEEARHSSSRQAKVSSYNH